MNPDTIYQIFVKPHVMLHRPHFRGKDLCEWCLAFFAQPALRRSSFIKMLDSCCAPRGDKQHSSMPDSLLLRVQLRLVVPLLLSPMPSTSATSKCHRNPSSSCPPAQQARLTKATEAAAAATTTTTITAAATTTATATITCTTTIASTSTSTSTTTTTATTTTTTTTMMMSAP